MRKNRLDRLGGSSIVPTLYVGCSNTDARDETDWKQPRKNAISRCSTVGAFLAHRGQNGGGDDGESEELLHAGVGLPTDG